MAALVILGSAAFFIPQLEFQSSPDELVSTSNVSGPESPQSSLFSTVEIQIWPNQNGSIPVEVARQLHSVLLRTEGVVNVLSAFRLFLPDNDGRWSPAFPLDEDPLLLRERVGIEIYQSLVPFFQEDSRSFRLIAVVNQSDGFVLDQLMDTVSESLRGEDEVRYAIGGIAPVFQDLPSTIHKDQRKLFVMSLALGFLAGGLLLWDFRLPALMVLPPALTLAALLSGLAALNLPVTVLTVSVTTLLLIVGVADALHLFVQWVRESPQSHGSKRAMWRALQKMVPVVAMTTGTTGLCFLAVAFVGSEALAKLGLIGAAGCVIQFVSLTVIWPAILLAFQSTFWLNWPNEKRPIPAIQLTSYHPRGGFWVVCVIAVTALLLALQTTNQSLLVVSDASPQAPPSSESGIPGMTLDDVYLPVRLMLKLNEGTTLLDEQGWAAFVAMTSRLHDSELGSLVSVEDGLRAIPPDARARALETLQRSDPLRRQATSLNLENPSVLLLVPWQDDLVSLRDNLADIEAVLQQSHPIDQLQMSPVIADLIDQTDRTVAELRTNALLAMVLAVFILGMVFRSWRIGFALLMCNALPVLSVLAVAQLVWGGIGIEVAMAATIAFGIALDDSIHTICCLRRNGALADASTLNIERAMRSIGPVLMTTTIILVTGMAAMLFSAFIPVERYGIAIILALILALFSDLVLLPSFLRTLRPQVNSSGAV